MHHSQWVSGGGGGRDRGEREDRRGLGARERETDNEGPRNKSLFNKHTQELGYVKVTVIACGAADRRAQPVPKFLEAFVARADPQRNRDSVRSISVARCRSSSIAHRSQAKAKAEQLLADRPDRDDEVPVIENLEMFKVPTPRSSLCGRCVLQYRPLALASAAPSVADWCDLGAACRTRSTSAAWTACWSSPRPRKRNGRRCEAVFAVSECRASRC